MTKEQLAKQVEYEGGSSSAIFNYEYGIDILPEDTPLPVVAKWQMFSSLTEHMADIDSWLYS